MRRRCLRRFKAVTSPERASTFSRPSRRTTWRWRPIRTSSRHLTSPARPRRRRRSSACASPSRCATTCFRAARNAVNMPSVSAEEYKKLRPYFELGEKLGALLAQISGERLEEVRISYDGGLAELNTHLVRNAV